MGAQENQEAPAKNIHQQAQHKIYSAIAAQTSCEWANPLWATNCNELN
jgi:hypothetical protein